MCRLFFIECVLHVCVFVWDGECWRRSLCGRGECEKLGVLTALEQLRYSTGAGGVLACWIFGQIVGVSVRSVEEWTGDNEISGRSDFQNVQKPFESLPFAASFY